MYMLIQRSKYSQDIPKGKEKNTTKVKRLRVPSFTYKTTIIKTVW